MACLYSSLPSSIDCASPASSNPARVSRSERILVLFHLGYLLIYIPCFVIYVHLSAGSAGLPPGFTALMAAHFIGMFLGFLVFVVLIRDLYLRRNLSANQKLTWGLLFVLFCPSIWVYFFRFAKEPRADAGDPQYATTDSPIEGSR